jgi:signal transduction histidine kinase
MTMSRALPAPVASSGAPALVLAGHPRARYLLGVGALAGLYYGAAELGYALGIAGPVAAILWLPAGVGIAFVYIGGLRYLPGVVIGDLLANDYSALPLGSALGQTCGNLLEMVVATLLLRRLVRRGSPLDSVAGVGGMLVAIAAGTAVSATVGPLSLLLGDVVASDALLNVCRTWWLGDMAGALVVVPLALAWYQPLGRTWSRERAIEALLVLVAGAGLSAVAFRSDRPVSYLVFPVLIWAALRFGQRAATLSVAIVVGIAAWSTAHYIGPFHFESITRSVLSTQLFIAVAALSTLCLAAVAAERETFAAGLRASRARLVHAGDAERRRLEQNLHDGAQQRLTTLADRLRRSADEARRAPESAPALFDSAHGEVELAIDELRELARGIHPAVLTDLGLASAIKSIAARSTVPILMVDLPSRRLDPTAEATAYYVVAEAVTNAQKHARASSIHIRAVPSLTRLHIEVSDDGLGGAVERSGSGLQGLRDRVEAVGGTFHVDSFRGHGTRIAAVIPTHPAAEPEREST